LPVRRFHLGVNLVGKINNYRFARYRFSRLNRLCFVLRKLSTAISKGAAGLIRHRCRKLQDPRLQLRAQQFQQVQRSQQHNLTRSLRFLTLSFSMGLNAGSFSPILGRSSLRRSFKQAVQVLISRNLVETAGCQREIDVGLM
jgi:hypothetical protein